nr:hypothetical protein [Pelobium sp.]
MFLIKKVKAYQPDLGAYIDHFHYNDDMIIIKLTNGFLKINDAIIEKHQNGVEPILDQELIKIGETFEKTIIG